MTPAPRIASLIPSGTDVAAALGFGDALVGVSHCCDHPVAEGLPVLTRSNVPAAGAADGSGAAPGDVDAAVGAALAAGESLYLTDRALLAELSPTVVLSQDVCDVCAVSGPAARAAVPDGAELVMLTATSLAGLSTDLRAVGRAVGAEDRASALARRIAADLDAVRARVAGRERPVVATIEWGDPPFIGGHWVPELVDVAGGRDALGSAGVPSRRATWEEIAAADPDVLVFLPCGYGLDAAHAEAVRLLDDPVVAGLRAVRDGRVWATDATRLFSRCTPAVTDAASALAAVLHPEVAGPPEAGDARRVVHQGSRLSASA